MNIKTLSNQLILLLIFFTLGAKMNAEEKIIIKNSSDCMSSKQKTIGMIGGVSWESTALYYKLINESVREHLGGLNSAKLILHSLNYDPIVNLELEERWDEVGKQIGETAKALQDAGADFVILCCNTLHKISPSIEAEIKIPFLHIADAAGKILIHHRIQKIGLLGTQFTMEDGFYASRLENKFGLEVALPDFPDRKILDHIIYQELCQGKMYDHSKNEILRIIKTLQKNGVEAVLLGCTELGMLIGSDEAEIPIYDTTKLHVKEAVKMSFQPL